MSEQKKVIAWYTANGKHIPIFEDNEPSSAEKKKDRDIQQAKEQADRLNNPLKAHFEKENARIKDFMSGNVKSAKQITMENGQVLERNTMKDMIEWVKGFKDYDDAMPSDNQVSIFYNDGTIKSWIDGDNLKDMKLKDIQAIIWDNESMQSYAGKGVKIVNFKELYPKDYPDAKGYEDDWRIDFDK